MKNHESRVQRYMSLTPSIAPGGNESGSGKTVVQLFSFGQTNGLPTILQVKFGARY